MLLPGNNESIVRNEEINEEMAADRSFHAIVYTVIVVVFSIISLVRTLLFFKVCMDASVSLHTSMFEGIIRAPMRFFEVNPVGNKKILGLLIVNLISYVQFKFEAEDAI